MPSVPSRVLQARMPKHRRSAGCRHETCARARPRKKATISTISKFVAFILPVIELDLKLTICRGRWLRQLQDGHSLLRSGQCIEWCADDAK